MTTFAPAKRNGAFEKASLQSLSQTVRGMVPLKKRRFGLLVKLVWRVRISVSTQDFHSCKRGPTPLRATKQ